MQFTSSLTWHNQYNVTIINDLFTILVFTMCVPYILYIIIVSSSGNITSKDFWVGFTLAVNDVKWQWNNGAFTEGTYGKFPWYPTEPTGGFECARISTGLPTGNTFFMADCECTKQYAFICQFK